MALIEGVLGGDYSSYTVIPLTVKPAASKGGAQGGNYANQASHTKINEAVTKISAVSGQYDPELMAFLAGELI